MQPQIPLPIPEISQRMEDGMGTLFLENMLARGEKMANFY
jgi:hypothetical protein